MSAELVNSQFSPIRSWNPARFSWTTGIEIKRIDVGCGFPRGPVIKELVCCRRFQRQVCADSTVPAPNCALNSSAIKPVMKGEYGQARNDVLVFRRIQECSDAEMQPCRYEPMNHMQSSRLCNRIYIQKVCESSSVVRDDVAGAASGTALVSCFTTSGFVGALRTGGRRPS